MSFQTGLSGLNASSRSLDVIGNNIANANTVGMKSSRAEFGDLIASSIGIGGGNTAGLGVSIGNVAQQFSQGNINITGNDLDVAINGGGFFQVTLPDGSPAYTRDGQFKLDKEGNLLTNGNANLMGYMFDANGLKTTADPTILKLPTGTLVNGNPTSTITTEFNLPTTASIYDATTDTPQSTTYSTSLTVYDSQGSPVPFRMSFTRAASTAATATAPALDHWDARDATGAALNDSSGNPISFSFDANGELYAPTTLPIVSIATPSSTTPSIAAELDISKITQFGSSFVVSNLNQDGYAEGALVSLKVGETGVVTATYSNGITQSAGQIELANFRNVQGLSPIGGNSWASTFASGEPVQGTPGKGQFGGLIAGAVEESNVDLTAELVNMMTAQRAYQANAQTIKTQDQVMSTLVNLR